MLGIGQVGLFGLLGWRLRQLQVVEGKKYSLLAEENRINIQPPQKSKSILPNTSGQQGHGLVKG